MNRNAETKLITHLCTGQGSEQMVHDRATKKIEQNKKANEICK